ncbi:MAG: hypothetical protein ACP5GS_08460 [Nitrososphaeria archaeon]
MRDKDTIVYELQRIQDELIDTQKRISELEEFVALLLEELLEDDNNA